MDLHYPYDGRQLCKKEDPELFFPEDYTARAKVNAAKAICNQCPLISDCLDYAISNADLDGIWGATTPRERQRLRSHRRKYEKVYS